MFILEFFKNHSNYFAKHERCHNEVSSTIIFKNHLRQVAFTALCQAWHKASGRDFMRNAEQEMAQQNAPLSPTLQQAVIYTK